jgi:hypothetical protein
MNDEVTLKTPASFKKLVSESQFGFTENSRAAVKKANKKISKIKPGFVKNFDEQDFQRVISNINSGDKTDLCRILEKNDCNKSIAHNYTYLYDVVLSPYRKKDINFVEVGLGTNNQDVPSMMNVNYQPGSSIRGWKEYFGFSKRDVYGVDIDERVFFKASGIKTGYLDQLDPSAIAHCYDSFGFDKTGIDVILDDGLHTFLSNFTLLISTWPYINHGGIYMIEDIATGFYNSMMSALPQLNLDADVIGFELPSTVKADNRVIMLQKR